MNTFQESTVNWVTRLPGAASHGSPAGIPPAMGTGQHLLPLAAQPASWGVPARGCRSLLRLRSCSPRCLHGAAKQKRKGPALPLLSWLCLAALTSPATPAPRCRVLTLRDAPAASPSPALEQHPSDTGLCWYLQVQAVHEERIKKYVFLA